VIQFAYQGAERAPQDAPSKHDALERAKALLPAAESDFKTAVSQGDAESSVDLGRIPRGVLEPHVEYAVFTLEPGEVTRDPIDTPRGFWIVRRNP
jgi:parvulin-like peptidyl-prolyl isomerase